VKSPFAVGATKMERIVWLTLIVLVACGVGVGVFELADHVR
jgi:hypothetical protein